MQGCLRYCKSTIFQANHNGSTIVVPDAWVVCDTAKVRFFKQITTIYHTFHIKVWLFAILQKYDFSSKSQLKTLIDFEVLGWIIVHEMEWGECMVNSISESPAIQKHTKKE